VVSIRTAWIIRINAIFASGVERLFGRFAISLIASVPSANARSSVDPTNSQQGLAAMEPNSPTDVAKPTPQHDAKLERAKKQVASIKGFYIHFFVFVVVMVGLFALNLALNYWADTPWWVQWPFLGWGIAVAAHAFAVFGHASKYVADWEERKIKQLMEQR
jgi:hypothetical protein